MHLVPPDARLAGRWSRTLLETPAGRRDTGTWVTWLQADSLYVDLRLPQPPPTVTAGCLRELDRDQAVALAAAEGFAGQLVPDGPWTCWRRVVDLQPAAPTPDEGRLAAVATPGTDDLRSLVETGRDGSYTEHWERADGPAEPRAAVLLRDESGQNALCVRVGDHMAWARGRGLPAGRSLPDLVAAAGTLTDAQDLLDAEVSMGRVGRPAGRSNLPWRVGSPLGVRVTGDLARTADVATDGRPIVRTWHVLSGERDLTDLEPA